MIPFEKTADRLSRKPRIGDYGLAIGLALAAVLCRSLFEIITPNSTYFITLFPAVVLAGVFCGTLPAVITAALGWIIITAMVFGRPLGVWPPFDSAQINAIGFIPACATVLWGTNTLRRFAAGAVAAEARLAEVFRQIPGAAALLEAPDGRLLLRSKQSTAVLNHGQGNVKGSYDLANYRGEHPDGRPFTADEYPIVRALKTGEIIQGEQLDYRHSNGRLVKLEVHAGPVRDAEGRIMAAVGMAFDITERVETERLLRESEEKHRAAVERLTAAIDAAALGLWELDLDKNRVLLDGRYAAMLGLPPEPFEAGRAEMMKFIDESDQPRAIGVLAAALASGLLYADELHMRTVQNEDRWLVTRGAILTDLRKVVGVIRDVTQRRARENALQAALDEREVLMREADHRIKNSLQLVVSLLRLQLNRVADQEAKEALDAAIARVEAIAEAHLALQLSPDLRNLDLERMLKDLCDRVGMLKPDIEIRFEAANIWLDAEQAIPLGLIASEVLTNALRHAFPAGMPGQVRMTAAAREGLLEMTIADSGVGLPATVVRRGLGTTLIAALARQIGAAIATESQPGDGTKVTLKLKIKAVAAASDGMDPVSRAAS